MVVQIALEFRSAEKKHSKNGNDFYLLNFEDNNSCPVQIVCSSSVYSSSNIKFEKGKHYRLNVRTNSLFLDKIGD